MSRPTLDLSDPAQRRQAWRRFMWSDHGVLRAIWSNFDEVAPGVFRANHPSPNRLRAYHAKGIRAVLNLRGDAPHPHHLFEAEACAELGMDLVSVALHARYAARPEQLQKLFLAFDAIQRPFVMHCKSGADRAGLAAALYLLDQGRPVAEARRQLSIRYLHLRRTRTGIQDHMLDLYEERLTRGPIPIREWIDTEYDREALTESFARKWTLPF